MDPKASPTIKILCTNYMITALTLLAKFARPTLSIDQKFEACAPRNCGDGPNISYPFWLANDQESFCGYPNFKITCNDEQNPILEMSNNDYIIKDIFYTNLSILVANFHSYEDSCPTPMHNLSLDGTPFSILPGYVNFSFFYNCTSKPNSDGYMYPINCSTNSTHSSYAGFPKELFELNESSFLKTCQSVVNAPVVTYGDTNSSVKLNYSEVLMMGFLLNWTAPNCSTCELSGGRCGSEHNDFICFCFDKPHSISCHDGGKSKKKIKAIIGVSTGIGSAAIVCLGFITYLRHKKRQNAPFSCVSRSISSDPSTGADIEKESLRFGVHLFSYAELEEATHNFDEKQELGDGGFGTVYYGVLRDGRAVAVKRLHEHNYKRVEQFMNEVSILTRLHHPNLVTLYGCTARRSRELLLVYEYISNGTVADHVHGEKAKPGSLKCPMRLKIAVETASALAYLHASDIIHRDVKTNNILLDQNFCVKVADFGLSRLFPFDVTHIATAPQGTPGYVDPEYHQRYQLTDKSDVFSFGVVLAELISSLPAVDITRHRHEINLSNMFINKIPSDALHELVDPSLGFDSDYSVRKMVSAVAELAFRCLQGEKELRPNMVEVLETLKEIQAGEYNLDKKADTDTPSDDIGLLKHGLMPLSSASVTAKWNSFSSTPNTSS